jgi:hypothetical protein
LIIKRSDLGIVIGKDEQEHRTVFAHRKARDLTSHLRVHHIHQFVARLVVRGSERGYLATEILLILCRRAEDEFANAGMQPGGADNQIELLPEPALELRDDCAVTPENAADAIAEYALDPAIDKIEDRRSQVATAKAEKIAPGHPPERIGAETTDPVPLGIDDAHFLADLTQARQEPHALGDLVSRAPEIDDVAAGAKKRATSPRWSVGTIAMEPPGQCQPRDTRS